MSQGCRSGRVRGYAIVVKSVLYLWIGSTSLRDRCYLYSHGLLEPVAIEILLSARHAKQMTDLLDVTDFAG